MSMSSGYGGAGPSGVRIDAISEAWGVVQKQLGAWIATAVIYVVIAVIFSFLQRSLGPHANADGTMGGSAALSFLISLANLAVSALMAGGLVRMALKAIRNEAISPGDLFSASDVALPLMGAGILAGLGIGIGAIFCLIPGLIIAGLLMLANPLIADQRVGTMAGLGMSWNALKPHWGSALVFVLVITVVNIVGMIPCGLGLLVTWPVSIVAVALIYCDFFKSGANTLNNNANLYPPIPNIPQ